MVRDVIKTAEQSLDATEDISYFLVPIEAAVQMCMNNEIVANNSVSAIMKAARILEDSRRITK